MNPSREPSPTKLLAWSIIAAFGTYFCMYMFRKPFTAATYDTLPKLGDYKYKTILVLAQVIGYTLSKFLGIKIVSELKPERRALAILILIGLAELALLGFGAVPAPYNIAFLFLNGLPLGMVFGLVIGFLEGRQVTEAMTAGLCVSFIVAGGVSKSVGAYLLQAGVPAVWMPFAAGLIFVPALGFFVWMLSRIPPPTAEDKAARSVRAPLSRAERRAFFGQYAFGLSAIVFAFLLVTILRSVRDDFAAEIWLALGVSGAPAIFTQSEVAVGIAVMLACGCIVLIRDNRRAFFLAIKISIAGLLLVCVALIGLRLGQLDPLPFMILLGIGLYIPYVSVHVTLFERLIAMTRSRGNLGYLMTLADSFGYLGYVLVILGKDFFNTGDFVRDFFDAISWVVAGGGILAFALAGYYFSKHVGLAASSETTPVPLPLQA